MTKTELEFRSALMETGIVQPTKSYSKGGRLEVLCRPMPGQEKAILSMLRTLLVAGNESGIIVHACKRFVMKEDKLVFGWNFAVETKSAKELNEAVEKMKGALVEVRPELVSAEETPELVPPPATPTPPPASPYKSLYKTDRQVMQESGLITVDPEAGRLGRLAPERSRTKYDLGKKEGFALSMVEKRLDDAGVPTIVFEMPLPHVTRELNVPNAKGKGAATVFKANVMGRSGK
jgi:hypothetical protein